MDDVQSEQALLYGAPVAELVRRASSALSLSQAAVARTIGVSPPMLSQLVTGHRTKIGNPVALERLQSLLALVDDVERGLPPGGVVRRLEEIKAQETTTMTRRRSEPVDGASVVAGLLRAVASGRQLSAAADAVEADAPELAAVLRVYGTGRPEDAQAHYASVAHLL